MNNLTFFILGLVLIYIPTSLPQNNKQCFSLTLNPSYPCCKGTEVVLTDEDGDWGVEDNKWCGIGGGHSDDSCFSVPLGYPCCESCKVLYNDEDGDWGVENDKWCGVKDKCTTTVDSDFEFSFMKMENNKKNMLYSPLSIKYALKMLQEGATGNTYDEINKVVGNSLPTKYTSFEQNLSLANGIFIRESFYDNVKQDYINTLMEKYNAEVRDDFGSANQWIEEKTLGILKNAINDSVLQNPDLIILLINALAIDMNWARDFEIGRTYGEIFIKEDGKTMEATMMFQKEVRSPEISYYIGNGITVLTMNLKKYGDTQLEFMAIMPFRNLSDFIKNVSKEQIELIDANLKMTSYVNDGVNVKIPKFGFSYEINLKNDLNKLGIKQAFDTSADFSKMSYAKEKGENLYVSEVIHKAEIEFNERGTKAGAVTGGKILSTIKYPVDVIIDQPFMFIIRDKNTKDIWFTGTVYEPNSWKNDKMNYEY